MKILMMEDVVRNLKLSLLHSKMKTKTPQCWAKQRAGKGY